jgi:hypothetical protein
VVANDPAARLVDGRTASYKLPGLGRLAWCVTATATGGLVLTPPSRPKGNQRGAVHLAAVVGGDW